MSEVTDADMARINAFLERRLAGKHICAKGGDQASVSASPGEHGGYMVRVTCNGCGALLFNDWVIDLDAGES